MLRRFLTVSNILLTLLWCIILLHFVKDVTQDLLNISTPLQYLGNIEENTNGMSTPLLWFFHWTMVNTFIGEVALLIAIPSQITSKTEFKTKFIIGILAYIVIAFTWAFLLQ